LAEQPLGLPLVCNIATNRLAWERWREGVTVKSHTLPEVLPCLLLVMDNLWSVIKNPGVAVLVLCARYFYHFPPLAGSWLNMATGRFGVY
jgi:hypothetical protein